NFLMMVVAIFGMTISPYLFFWQASQEAEESRLSHRSGYKARSKTGDNSFRHIAVDTWVGMLVSNVIAFFIIVTTAATLGEVKVFGKTYDAEYEPIKDASAAVIGCVLDGLIFSIVGLAENLHLS